MKTYGITIVGPDQNGELFNIANQVLISAGGGFPSLTAISSDFPDAGIVVLEFTPTAAGVTKRAVCYFMSTPTFDQLAQAFSNARQGLECGGDGSGGNGDGGIITTEGGATNGGGLGVGNGLLNINLPGIVFLIAAAYSAQKYNDDKNPVYLATAAWAGINFINKK